MVKFSKELEAQLIPEWKEAFVNYWQLKKIVKKIKLCRTLNPQSQDKQDFGFSILDPIRRVRKKILAYFSGASDEEHEVESKPNIFLARYFPIGFLDRARVSDICSLISEIN